jgi:protein gp37
MASSIEWLNGGETWNPIRARLKEIYTGTVLNPLPIPIPKGKVGWMCVKVSPGCEGCYAEHQNVTCGTNPGRNGTGQRYAADKLPLVELFLDEKTLLAPLHWKRPRLIFPCSMTDWMADFVPDEWRDKMLAVMALTPQHTYLTLTKRADRQQKFLSRDPEDRIDDICHEFPGSLNETWHYPAQWPLPNLWLGTSAEDQKRADERIPELLQTPAAVRWVSAEPLLEAIDLNHLHLEENFVEIDALNGTHGVYRPHGGKSPRLDWIVVGGESGPGARPFNIEWARQIIAQGKAARVPVFVKQLGAVPVMDEKTWRAAPTTRMLSAKNHLGAPEGTVPILMNDAKGGDIENFPKELQVREYPEAPHGSL